MANGDSKNTIDIHSQTWSRVGEWALSELKSARAQLEAPGTPIDVTENCRGKIELIKALLSLANPSRQIAQEDLLKSSGNAGDFGISNF